MSSKAIKLPAELATFIKKGGTTLRASDGDWELRVRSREDSPIRGKLPPRSIVIAENGSGDFLFLRGAADGKSDGKLFVYWHEEERHEPFGASLRELIGKTLAGPSGDPGDAPTPAKPAIPRRELEKALSSKESRERSEALRRLKGSDFGVEVLPVLRKALASNDVDVAILAADCIGMLGPGAKEHPAAESDPKYDHTDLDGQLKQVGGKIWGYSDYANCYSACLCALMNLRTEEDEDFLVEYVQMHIGLNNPDDLLASLEALRDIGTDDAIDLLKRAAAFWMPELNLAQAKKVKELIASAGRARKR